MPERSSEQWALYSWIKENTSHDNRFFFTQSENPKNAMHDPDYSFFVTYTGRFLVKRGFNSDTSVGKESTIISIEESCNETAMKELKIDYVVLELETQKKWFNAHCKMSNFKEVYDEGDIQVLAFLR